MTTSQPGFAPSIPRARRTKRSSKPRCARCGTSSRKSRKRTYPRAKTCSGKRRWHAMGDYADEIADRLAEHNPATCDDQFCQICIEEAEERERAARKRKRNAKDAA